MIEIPEEFARETVLREGEPGQAWIDALPALRSGPSCTAASEVRNVERHLSVTYTRANKLVGQLVEVGTLRQHGDSSYGRRFTAPDVLAILLR